MVGRELYLVDLSIYEISASGCVMSLAVWLDVCRAEYAESRQRKLGTEKGLMMMVVAAPGRHEHPKHKLLLYDILNSFPSSATSKLTYILVQQLNLDCSHKAKGSHESDVLSRIWINVAMYR